MIIRSQDQVDPLLNYQVVKLTITTDGPRSGHDWVKALVMTLAMLVKRDCLLVPEPECQFSKWVGR